MSVKPQTINPRELDAWLAEHLFGYFWILNVTGTCRVLTEASSEPNATGNEALCEDAYRYVPHYSTTGDGMLAVESRLIERGYTVASATGIHDGKYRCVLTIENAAGREVASVDDSMPRPMALALAAKAALEQEQQ